MKQLGIIRISASGTVFEVPYFDEGEFDQVVVAMKAFACYHRHGLYIPEPEISWMVRVPKEAQNTVDDLTESGGFGRGATRQ